LAGVAMAAEWGIAVRLVALGIGVVATPAAASCLGGSASSDS